MKTFGTKNFEVVADPLAKIFYILDKKKDRNTTIYHGIKGIKIYNNLYLTFKCNKKAFNEACKKEFQEFEKAFYDLCKQVRKK